MARVDHQRLLIKVAQLYYEQELTQSEIGRRLLLSRQKVQRLLSEARDQGIVRISIRPVIGVYSEIEQALERRYDLREVVLVETRAYEDQAAVMHEIGVGAAEYLLRVAQPDDIIVVSWGGSLLGMVDALQADGQGPDFPELKVVQGLGGLGDPTRETHAADLARRLAKAVGGQAVLLPAPGVAGTAATAKAYRADPFVDQALKLGAGANLAFMGMGAPREDSILIREGAIVRWEELSELQTRGAAGDINLRFFDHSGRLVESDLNNRVIGLTLDDLRRIDTVVGVAGGEVKLKAIRGALEGNLVDVLVTDHISGQRLLEVG